VSLVSVPPDVRCAFSIGELSKTNTRSAASVGTKKRLPAVAASDNEVQVTGTVKSI